MSSTRRHCDVAIIGGGLAGSTLALQLKSTNPALAINVFERSQLPPPAAAHKVGESTVEIGSHYLAHTVQLKDLLDKTQLRKFGLRFFFDAASHKDLARTDELGASDYFQTTSYQLDRGILEGSLASILRQKEIDLHADTRVVSVEMANGTGTHQIKTRSPESEQVWQAGFVVDAASRASILQRSLGLKKPTEHRVCAAWFRLDQVISVDEWSENTAWQERCNGHPRQLSTNHLMGPGYWMWIIPLVGNRTSIGLVADPKLYPVDQFNTFPKFLEWARTHQPFMAEKLEAAQDQVMDFLFLRDLARDSSKSWSDEGWALAGESGIFADPFYSPGTDYIGIGNGFITDLVCGEWSAPERQFRSTLFNAFYRSFFGSTLSLYQGQYAGFADSRLMAVKSTWDYAYYWSVLCWMFFRDVMTDLPFMRECEPDFQAMLKLNTQMQARFREQAKQRNVTAAAGRFIDQKAIPILPELNRALHHPDRGPAEELRYNCQRLKQLVPSLLNILDSTPASTKECSLLGDLGKRLD